VGVAWDLLTEEEGRQAGLLPLAMENRGSVNAALTEAGEEAVDGDAMNRRHVWGSGICRHSEGRASRALAPVLLGMVALGDALRYRAMGIGDQRTGWHGNEEQ
jgi:hypothetical protein